MTLIQDRLFAHSIQVFCIGSSPQASFAPFLPGLCLLARFSALVWSVLARERYFRDASSNVRDIVVWPAIFYKSAIFFSVRFHCAWGEGLYRNFVKGLWENKSLLRNHKIQFLKSLSSRNC